MKNNKFAIYSIALIAVLLIVGGVGANQMSKNARVYIEECNSCVFGSSGAVEQDGFDDGLSLGGITNFSGLDVSGDSSFDTDSLFVDSSEDSVGISTTTPAYTLSVNAATSTQSYANATSTSYIYSFFTGAGGQIILEDEDGAGCTAISVLNGTLNGNTIACPAE